MKYKQADKEYPKKQIARQPNGHLELNDEIKK